jgi:hypothetical protein
MGEELDPALELELTGDQPAWDEELQGMLDEAELP